jgi:homoserine O-succinyltransferase
VTRTHLERKRWGVYSHRVIAPHPLFYGTNTRFGTPHSRFNDVSEAQMRGIGLRVLATSEEAGVLCATSADGFRYVYFQGHPEYDAQSLPKEFKREVFRYLEGERPDYPPVPEHCFDETTAVLLESYRRELEAARAGARPPPEFPEDAVLTRVENTWTDTGKAIFNNWLGLVYRLTHVDRDKLFMPGVDPENPLGLL